MLVNDFVPTVNIDKLCKNYIYIHVHVLASILYYIIKKKNQQPKD